METNYLAGLLKINATSAEVSVQSYEVDGRSFVKVTGCDSNGGLLAHMETSAAEYYQIIDQAGKWHFFSTVKVKICFEYLYV